MNKKKNIIFYILFLTVFLLGTTSNSFNLGGITYNSFISKETKYTEIPLSATNETIFGTPILTPSKPTSFNDVLVSCPINDADGVKNATIFWKYTTIDSMTEYNSIMTGGENLIVDVTAFQSMGYITNTGIKTSTPTNWRYGEYVYQEQGNNLISRIDLSVLAPGASTFLVYILIEAINFTTGEWENRYQDGGAGGTTEVSPMPPPYTSTELTTGYRIFAITYRSTIPPNYPTFDHLEIYRVEYEHTIPALDQPTWVSYHIEAYDILNNWMESGSYNFLMDSPPTVQFNNLPTVIADSGTLNLNVTVIDPDGWENIGVTAYYHIENPTAWTPSSLTFSANISSTAAYYTGSISIPDIGNVERDLTLYVNASDVVGGVIGYKGTTGEEIILVDGQNPSVENIVVEGGVSIPGVEDVVLITSNVTITADFIDPSGIEEVYIYYAIPNGTTFIKQAMVNLTSSEPNEISVSYTATLPPANVTRYVAYYFEAKDYLGNIGTSSSYLYYADGAAPTLSAIKVFPNLITENTQVNVLFNAIDPSNLEDSILWYQLTGENVNNVIAQAINYNPLIDYQEIYTVDVLPVLIQDKNTTIIEIEVKRNDKVDTASVSVDVTHENAADLRMWLRGGSKRVLLYDRMPNTLSFSFTVDLFAHGFQEEDFSNNILKLEIEDFSLDFSGSVTDFSIELAHHSIPLGYQFRGIIPATTVDTDVEYWLTLTDSLLNQANSSKRTYYADALAPTINVTQIISPLDLGNSYFIEVTANVTDKGGILDVYLYYRFAIDDEWTIVDMDFVSGDLYSGKIIINSQKGDAFFKVRAFDLINHSNETEVIQINFTNGLYPNIIVLHTPFADPLDMNENKIFRVQANLIDEGIITSAMLFYRFKSNGKWTELALEYDTETGYYFGDIELPWKKGLLQFKIRATDDSNFTAETVIYSVNYINSGGVNLVWVIVPSSVGGVALIGGAVFFVLKKRRRWGKK